MRNTYINIIRLAADCRSRKDKGGMTKGGYSESVRITGFEHVFFLFIHIPPLTILPPSSFPQSWAVIFISMPLPRTKPIMGCDSRTHAPAKTSSTDAMLCPFVLRICSTNSLGHGHGYECQAAV